MAALRRIVIPTCYFVTFLLSSLREGTLLSIYSGEYVVRLLAIVVILVLLFLALAIHRSFPKTHEKASDFPALRTTGVYGRCRHPLYLTLILLQFSISLYFYSTEGIVVALLTLPAWYILARNEEKDLLQHYGKAYKEYMKLVRMYVPLRRRKPQRIDSTKGEM
jgi:protein-S-isoprenylcysteine O-methyltransferase Ste14